MASLTVLGLLSVTGCVDGAQPAPSSADTTSPTASARLAPTGADHSALVDIGAGRTMYLECSGTGAPTVVLISGIGDAGDVWHYSASDDEAKPAAQNDSAVFPHTARFTRVCTYDRPGTRLMDHTPSRSSVVPQPTTTQSDAADLHALLTRGMVKGPYVLVGHSLGGFIATMYARTYPGEVAGLVLVDPISQYLKTTLPPAVWTQTTEFFAKKAHEDPGAENLDYSASITALDATTGLPPMPVTVLTSDKPWNILGQADAAAYWPQWLKAQNLLATALRAKHITRTNSDHAIEIENAPLVVEQICTTVAPAGKC